MKNKVYKKNDNLVIVVPFFTERIDPYGQEDSVEQMENIIGVITNQEWGFAYRIDQSYKDKGDDISSLFYISDCRDPEEFKLLCKKLQIQWVEYQDCAYCYQPIYGSFTSGDKGDMCYGCYLKLSPKE